MVSACIWSAQDLFCNDKWLLLLMLVSLQNFGTTGKEHPLFPQQRVVEAPVLALSCPDDWVPAMRRKLCQVHLTTEAFKL